MSVAAAVEEKGWTTVDITPPPPAPHTSWTREAADDFMVILDGMDYEEGFVPLTYEQVFGVSREERWAD